MKEQQVCQNSFLDEPTISHVVRDMYYLCTSSDCFRNTIFSERPVVIDSVCACTLSKFMYANVVHYAQWHLINFHAFLASHHT